MVNERVKEFLVSNNLGDRLTVHSATIDTVEHAAQQIGCTEPEIAKTLSFAVADNIPIWLDVSMKRFDYVHPAGGNEFTSVKLTPSELETVTGAKGWCDVCKGWEETV